VKLYFFDECCNEPSKPWLIKHVIACDEDSLWFGAPGSLKSSLLTDIAVHLAAGGVWRGYKVKASAGVVYFAFERAGLTKRRLAAHSCGRRWRHHRFD
jgi:RecA-family ATPase